MSDSNPIEPSYTPMFEPPEEDQGSVAKGLFMMWGINFVHLIIVMILVTASSRSSGHMAAWIILLSGPVLLTYLIALRSFFRDRGQAATVLGATIAGWITFGLWIPCGGIAFLCGGIAK